MLAAAGTVSASATLRRRRCSCLPETPDTPSQLPLSAQMADRTRPQISGSGLSLRTRTSSTQTAVRRWCAILIERISVGLRVPMLGASALRATKPSSSNRHGYNARLHPSRSCTLAAAGLDGPGYPHKQPRGRELTVGLRASLTGLDPTIIQLVEMEATPHPK